jgi:hypothetical protein
VTTYICTVIYGWEEKDYLMDGNHFSEDLKLWDKVDIELVDNWKDNHLAYTPFREYVEEQALDQFDATIGLNLENRTFVFVHSISVHTVNSDVDIAPDWADKWPN